MDDAFAQAIVEELDKIRQQLVILNQNLQVGTPMTFAHELTKTIYELQQKLEKKGSTDNILPRTLPPLLLAYSPCFSLS